MGAGLFLNMSITATARRLSRLAVESFRDGNWSVFLTLALCLTISFGGIGFIVAGALISIARTRFRLIPDALRLYGTEWLRSDALAINMLVLVITLVQLALLFYHWDDLSQFENQVKQYVTALAVLLTIRRFPVQLVLWGAAAGCVLATVVAVGDGLVYGTVRAAGPTNAVRFGMVAALLSMLSLTGAMFGGGSRAVRVFFAIAAVFGLYAAFASGTRSALVAMPIIVLLLLPGLWRKARTVAIVAAVLFAGLSVALGIWQMKVLRYATSDTEMLVELPLLGETMLDQSIRDRVVMLGMSATLLATNPLFGVGDAGWAKAVQEQRRAGAGGTALEFDFNQAHNQYANDFAKGGLLRGVGGLALIALPLVLFLRRRPFDLDRESLAPLLGVITCSAYAVFGLTESVMDLSLTSSLYIVLVFYLMASTEGAPMTHPLRASRIKLGGEAA